MTRFGNLCLAILILCAFAAGPFVAAGNDAELFPFTLPADDVTQGVTDLSWLNNRPADQLVTVRDGHFYAGSQRIRFWGVCVIGPACFPTHEQATPVAQHLASRGMNQVRIHLIDGGPAPAGLFDPDPAHKNELRILPAQLDKLDFFIAELKKHGIYVELPINGYHFRQVIGAAEYPGTDFKRFASFASGIPLWNPQFIAAEQRFAREFFTHVNPYTGKSYVEEPCVSTMEIVNENGLICAWRGGHVRKAWSDGMIADLQGRWNEFLKSRHGTTAKLRQAWSVGEVVPDAREMLKSGDFAGGNRAMAQWFFQVAKPSTGTAEVLPTGGPGGRPCLQVTGQRVPQDQAFIILQQLGLAIENKCAYELSFSAKAKEPLRLSVGISMSHAPWSAAVAGTVVDVESEWRQFKVDFIGTRDEPAAKLMISLPTGASQVWFAGLSLRKAAVVGLPAGESLDGAGNVTMPLAPEDCARRTPALAADFVDFLYDLDARYFDAMRDFVKNDLRAKHPLKGTQVDQYSSYFSQSRFDYLDSHGYWEHPSFPHKPWDPNDWTVGNSPMVNRGGLVVVELAGKRVRGKPFNISEYCHPAPSTYCAEQVPTIAALGALQDWDGVAFHCWMEQTYDWRRKQTVDVPADHIDSWFNMVRHPVKLVTLPFGALAFRRGDVAAARQETMIGVTLDEEKTWLRQRAGSSWHTFDAAAGKGATWLDAFTHRIGLDLGSSAQPTLMALQAKAARSDTDELAYDLSNPAAGVITVNAPRAKAVIGFGAGRTFELGDVTIKPGPTMQKGYSVITASGVRGENFHAAGAAVLITATGYVENKGMVWNEQRTSVGSKWGDGPVMCEGIPFELIFKARRATLWPLDAHGHRLAPVPAQPCDQGTRFILGPQYKTLWYELAVE